MRPTLYMIRHGQTDWNANRRLQGQTEVPMNAYGRSQVANNAHKLASLANNPRKFDYISSPILRARETMNIVRETLGLARHDYRIDERLKELDYGEFARHTWDELRQTRPADVDQRFETPWTYVIPNGECYAMLSSRVLTWFHELKRDSIITAHAGVSRVLQAQCSQCPEDEVAFLEAPQDRILVLKGNKMSWL